MAGFGAFTFAADESENPVDRSYRGWLLSPSYSEARPLGSARDDVTYLARGSRRCTFSNRLTQARFDAAEALVGTEATFQDFDSPTPSTRTAVLLSLTPEEWVINTTLTSVRKVRARWEFVEV